MIGSDDYHGTSDGAVAPQARNFGTEYWSRAIFSISIGTDISTD
jgi:hypothetical protein